MGWLYRQTFYEDLSHLQEEIPRLIGEDLMAADASLYSQHVKGVANIIVDILSRSNLSAHKLVQLLKENHHGNFWIVELPEEIILWILSILAKGTQTEALSKEHKTHKRKHSIKNGPTSPLNAELTYTCGVVQQRKRM